MEKLIKRLDSLEYKGKILVEPPIYFDNLDHSNQLSIVQYVPNDYWQQEKYYIQEGDYYKPKDPKYRYIRIHKSCFEHILNKLVLASVINNEGDIDIKFMSIIPIMLDSNEWAEFQTKLKEAVDILTNEDTSNS